MLTARLKKSLKFHSSILIRHQENLLKQERKAKANRPKLRRKVMLNKRKHPFIDDEAACADESDE